MTDKKSATTPIARVNAFLRKTPGVLTRKRDRLAYLLETFVSENAKPNVSPNYLRTDGKPDDMTCLSRVLDDCGEKTADGDIAEYVLQVFKILLRREENRQTIEKDAIMAIVSATKRATSSVSAREGANCVLNMCYDIFNVGQLIEISGVHVLLNLLKSGPFAGNDSVDASLAGALQSVCYQKRGRARMRDLGAVEVFVSMLPGVRRTTTANTRTKKKKTDRQDYKTLSRVVGVLHNMSADPLCADQIRDCGGIVPLTDLLRHPSNAVKMSASGAIQNLARDEDSRGKILAIEFVVPTLVQYLFMGDDVSLQASATSALLALIDADETKSAASLKRLISSCVTLGCVESALFDEFEG